MSDPANQLRQRTDLSQATAYTGSCEDMCPERERNSRLGQRTSIFERDPTTNISNEYAMVKEYRRAGADQEEPAPDDLRTPNALKNTVDYLITNIMDDERSKSLDYALEWYDFLWDRLRAVRKDITQQNICNELSAILVEQCTRFHVHSCYALNRVKDFDVNMNKRNLNDCLQMLRQIYQDLKESYGITCMGEFEFKKYNILLHLGEDALTTNSLMKDAENRSMKEAKLITDLFNSYSNNDYFRFFKLMQKADYMTSCILSLYVNKMRLNAMKIILAACNLKQPILYPAKMIIESLAFDDVEDLSTFTSHFEIEIQRKDSIDYIILKKEHVEAFRQLGSTLPEAKSRRLVEDKMAGQTVGQLVYGVSVIPVSKPMPIEPVIKAPLKPISTWFKNRESIPPPAEVAMDVIKETSPINNTRYKFKKNSVKPVDVPSYHMKNDNSLKEIKPEPVNVSINRSVGIRDEPVVSKQDTTFATELAKSCEEIQEVPEVAPSIEDISHEIIAEPDSPPDNEQLQLAQMRAKRASFVADLMPVGKLRRSKRLMPKFGPIPQEPKRVAEKDKKARKESKRNSDINSIKEWASEEERANQEFFRIVRMVI